MRSKYECSESGIEIGNIIGRIPFDKVKQGLRVTSEQSENLYVLLVPIVSGITGQAEVEATTYRCNGHSPQEVKKAYYERKGRHIIGFETELIKPTIHWADG